MNTIIFRNHPIANSHAAYGPYSSAETAATLPSSAANYAQNQGET